MFNPCYTQLKLDIQDLTIKYDYGTFIDTIISLGQTELESLIIADGDGLPFMESSPIYTPGLLTDTNSFQLPNDYLSMLYIAPTDQLSSPVVSLVGTTGTLTAGTYYYRVTAINAYGETLGSEEKSLTVGASSGVVLSWVAITGATSYKVYGRTTNNELFIASTVISTYTDNGSITPLGSMPLLNTSGKNRYNPINRNSAKKFGDLNGSYIDKENKGKPDVFIKKGSVLYFNKYADVDYGIDFRYYKKATTLSDTNVTNVWTDEKNYKALLYSCLVETIPYLGDDPRSKTWLSVRDQAVYLLRAVNTRERISGANRKWVSPNVFLSGKW